MPGGDVGGEGGPGDGCGVYSGEGRVQEHAVEVGGGASAEVGEGGRHGGVHLVGDGEGRVVGHVVRVLA